MTTYYVDGAVGNDSNAGTSGGGNAWATMAKAFATAAAPSLVNVKASADYVQTSTLTPTNSGSESTGPIVYRGYTTTPGDGGQPLVTTATDSTILLDFSSRNMAVLDSFRFTNTASVRADGIRNATNFAAQWTIVNCTFDGFAYGIHAADDAYYPFQMVLIDNCKFINCSSSGAWISSSSGQCDVRRCLFSGNHDGLTTGLDGGGMPILSGCVFSGNSRYGVVFTNMAKLYVNLSNCVVRDNASDGVSVGDASGQSSTTFFRVENTIFWNNGGYAINNPGPVVFQYGVNRSNFYGSNTGGDRNNVAAGTGDVTLTADPHTNAAGGDFSLNNTAGGGALVRGAGFPGVSPFGTGYADGGPLQSQAAGGGGSGPTSFGY